MRPHIGQHRYSSQRPDETEHPTEPVAGMASQDEGPSTGIVATSTTEKPNDSCVNVCHVKPSCTAIATTTDASATDAAAMTHAATVNAFLDDRTASMVPRRRNRGVRAGTDAARTGTDAHRRVDTSI